MVFCTPILLSGFLLFWSFTILPLTDADHTFLKRALKIAARGRGSVSPNPLVGAVLVGANGQPISVGWHSLFGGDHAEIVAIQNAPMGSTAGATLYVNLEPCCHQGKTPPCTEAILKAGIKRVIAATLDPNPLVNGKGFALLSEAGVEVVSSVRVNPARKLNRGYFSVVERGRAWCTAKIALSLDGKMANRQGVSKWISGAASRKLAHKLRAEHDGVLVGAGTVANDDPELTVRAVRGPNPTRVILLATRSIPAGSKIAMSASQVRTIVVLPEGRACQVPSGIDRLELPLESGKISPKTLLERLPSVGVCSLLVEGGAGVLSSFAEAGVIDELMIAYAPSIIGAGLSPFEQFLPKAWEARPQFQIESTRRYGEDVVVTYRPKA